jgi:hypothetical protein
MNKSKQPQRSISVLTSTYVDATPFLDFNKVPPGWEEISIEDFATSNFFVYTPYAMDYRQFWIKEDGKKKMIDCKVFFMDKNLDEGFAIHSSYWEKKIRIFRFGCKHKWIELSPEECKEKGIPHSGRCYHVNECETCKKLWIYDSSD